MANFANPLTAARRDKFKCTLFCFRSYVEDAAFFIAVLGIFLTIVLTLIGNKEFSHHLNRKEEFEYFGISALSILLHVGILLALIARVPALAAPYILFQAIGLVYVGYYLFYSGYVVLTRFPYGLESFAQGEYSKHHLPADWFRFEALNCFVVLGTIALFQVWILSIVWRAMSAVKFQQIAEQLAKDQQQATTQGPRMQEQQPVMVNVTKPANFC